MTEAKAAIPV